MYKKCKILRKIILTIQILSHVSLAFHLPPYELFFLNRLFKSMYMYNNYVFYSNIKIQKKSCLGLVCKGS